MGALGNLRRALRARVGWPGSIASTYDLRATRDRSKMSQFKRQNHTNPLLCNALCDQKRTHLTSEWSENKTKNEKKSVPKSVPKCPPVCLSVPKSAEVPNGVCLRSSRTVQATWHSVLLGLIRSYVAISPRRKAVESYDTLRSSMAFFYFILVKISFRYFLKTNFWNVRAGKLRRALRARGVPDSSIPNQSTYDGP